MLRRLGLLFTILVLSALVSHAADQNIPPGQAPEKPEEKTDAAEPPSFAGIPFGCTPKEAQAIMEKAGVKFTSKEKDKVSNDPNLEHYYYAGNKSMSNVKRTDLQFYKGKLLNIALIFMRDKIEPRNVIKILSSQYGKPNKVYKGQEGSLTTFWSNKNQVKISFFGDVHGILVTATYTPIEDERRKDTKNQ